MDSITLVSKLVKDHVAPPKKDKSESKYYSETLDVVQSYQSMPKSSIEFT